METLQPSPDLQRVVVSGRVLEQPVVRVEHLLGQQIEPFPCHAAIVEADLAWYKYRALGLTHQQ